MPMSVARTYALRQMDQFINFGGILAVSEIWALALSSYVLKFLLAVAMTPVIYLGHAILGRTFQLHAAPTS